MSIIRLLVFSLVVQALAAWYGNTQLWVSIAGFSIGFIGSCYLFDVWKKKYKD